MANYYDEILNEIQEEMNQRNWQKALNLIERELAMPYIPQETEKKLNQMKKDAVYQSGNEKKNTEISADALLEMLNDSDPTIQLSAAAGLSGRRLDEYTETLQKYLKADPSPEAAAFLIEALCEQKVPAEFEIVKDEMEYTFWPDSVIPVYESKGYLKAEKLLREWLADDNPGMYEMAREMLVHEVYLYLPLSYEETEAQILAMQILEKISSMLDDGKTCSEMKKKLNARN